MQINQALVNTEERAKRGLTREMGGVRTKSVIQLRITIRGIGVRGAAKKNNKRGMIF